VIRRWRCRWRKSATYTLVQVQRITKCIEIAERCTQKQPEKRPPISDIIRDLDESANTDANISAVNQVSPSDWAQRLYLCINKLAKGYPHLTSSSVVTYCLCPLQLEGLVRPFVEIRQRLFCFEYISNGSLEKYITGKTMLNWWILITITIPRWRLRWRKSDTYTPLQL
jgi:hypothetical protein